MSSRGSRAARLLSTLAAAAGLGPGGSAVAAAAATAAASKAVPCAPLRSAGGQLPAGAGAGAGREGWALLRRAFGSGGGKGGLTGAATAAGPGPGAGAAGAAAIAARAAGAGAGPRAGGRLARSLLLGGGGGPGGGAWGGGGGGAAAAGVRSVWQDARGYQHFEGRGGRIAFGGRRMWYGLAAAGAAGVSYYVYCLEEIPYTGRRHSIMLVSAANERLLGKAMFEEQKAIAAAEGRLLPPSHPEARRVAAIGARIAAVAAEGGGGGAWGHMKGLDWEYAVIANNTPNAFVVPGGKVVVFTGLLQLLGRSEDELAAVIAHEVAHVLARHPAERMSTLNVWTLLNLALRLTLGFGLPDMAMFMGVFLPYSRLAEVEADLIGLRLMAAACFDPVAAPAMLAKLHAREKVMEQSGLAPRIPAFLRTHPLTDQRVKAVEAELAEAYRIYYDRGCGSTLDAFGRGMRELADEFWGPGGGPRRGL